MEQFTFTADRVSMEFPGVKALEEVNFQIASGEIRAVVGANGAGKSTLMKVLAGVYPNYGGTLYLNGEKVDIKSPAAAKQLGIQIVYQEVDTALLPDFTVYENLLLEDWSQAGLLYRRRRLRREAEAVLDKLNISLDSRKAAGKLTLAQKQQLLIAKAVYKDCRLLILDEPTAALSQEETKRLFDLIRGLVQQRTMAIVFISHRISEILGICESCTVLRAGRVTDEFPITEQTKTAEIVGKMLGGQIVCNREAAGSETAQGKSMEKAGEDWLEVEHLCDREGLLKQVSFHIGKGEIVGLAGLVGSGKTEVCKTLFGARMRARRLFSRNAKAGGRVRLAGKELPIRSPHDAVASGIALVPEERRREGLFLAESLGFNLGAASLKQFCTLSFVRKRRMYKKAREMIALLGMACRDERQPAALLSGGNQQKVVIGKWMERDCLLYLLDEPMQGVDVGAKQEIFRLIRRLAAKGASVLYASCDPMELMNITQRIYVLYNGSIVQELRTMDTNESELMFYMSGGKAEQEKQSTQTEQ